MDNTLTEDGVRLYHTILHNAAAQFDGLAAERHAPQRMATAALAVEAVPLTASVDTQVVSGETQYCIATSTTGTSWAITLSLSLNQAISEIPYVVLSYTQLDGTQQEMAFEKVEQADGDNQYKAANVLHKLEQRDALLQALANYDAKTTLVVAVRTSDSLLNTITDPQIFYFAPDYYPYIYRGIAPPKPRQGFILKTYPFDNIWYNYYQDNITKNNLYYLADRYQLGVFKDNGKPMLSFAFTVPPGSQSLDEVQVVFSYFLLPAVNRQRIAAAATAFEKEQKGGRLIPLNNATATSLSLELPSPAGKTAQKDAIINLQSGVRGSFTVPYHQFVPVWDAFFDTSPMALLLRGVLSVTLKGFNPNPVPVALTMPQAYKGNPEAFLAPTSTATISKTITFKSDAAAYDPNGPKPIKNMLVDCGGTTKSLDKDQPTATFEYPVPLMDLINGKGGDIRYAYNLQIRYQDGDVKQFPSLSSTFEIIYVPPAL